MWSFNVHPVVRDSVPVPVQRWVPAHTLGGEDMNAAL